METCLSETLVSTCEFIRRYNPEYQHRQQAQLQSMDYSHLARPKFKQLRKLWLLTISRCRSVLLRVSMISVKYYNLAPMLSNFHLVSTRRFLAGFYSTSNPVNVFLNKFMDASYAWNRVPGKFKTKFSPILFAELHFTRDSYKKTRCSRVYRTIFTQTMITSKHD